MRRQNKSIGKALRFYGLILAVALVLAGAGGIVYEKGLLIIPGAQLAEASLAPAPRGTSDSGLPVPRFVSLKKSRINVRRGPGKKHAVLWIFTAKGLPVEITAEFENWRRIRDSSGEEGWIFHSLLSGARSVVISPWRNEGRIELSEKPSGLSEITAFLEPNVTGQVDQCTGSWCRISAHGFTGWVEQKSLWGVYPGEVVE